MADLKNSEVWVNLFSSLDDIRVKVENMDNGFTHILTDMNVNLSNLNNSYSYNNMLLKEVNDKLDMLDKKLSSLNTDTPVEIGKCIANKVVNLKKVIPLKKTDNDPDEAA
jgi:hypothetical protein